MLLQTLRAHAGAQLPDEGQGSALWPRKIRLTEPSSSTTADLLPAWAAVVADLVGGAPPTRALQSLFEDVLAMDVQPDAVVLPLAKEIHAHTAQCVQAQLEDAACASSEPAPLWLQRWIERWRAVVARARTVHMLVQPLFVRARALEPQGTWDVHALCVECAHAVLRHPSRQTQLHRALNALVREVREHRLDASLLQQAMHAAAELAWDVHLFYEQATPFYRAMSATMAAPVPTDVRAAQIPSVLAAVRNERAWSCWVPGAEERSTAEVVVAEVVQPHLASWAQTVPWLCEHAPSDLQALYDLSCEAHLLEPLRHAVREHVQQQVARDMEAEPATLLPRLMAAQTAWHALCVAHLRDSAALHHAVNDALESAINVRRHRVVERLVALVDERLRDASAWASDDVSGTLQPIVSLFRCLYDKDLFQRLYQRQLAQRLLERLAASPRAEEAMLALLRQECGPDYTHRLETMWHDQRTSELLQAAWSSASKHAARAPFPVAMHVLTQAHWPAIEHVSPVAVPAAVEAEAARFEAYYRQQHPSRSLRWHHGLDTVELRADLGAAGIKELHASAPQAVVLLQFQGMQPRTLAELRNATGLEPAMLRRVLHSLTSGPASTRVLRPLSPGSDVCDTSTFHVNEALDSDNPCVVLWKCEDEEETQAPLRDEQPVTMDRDVVLQATAMRLLKAASPQSHASLTVAMKEHVCSRYVLPPNAALCRVPTNCKVRWTACATRYDALLTAGLYRVVREHAPIPLCPLVLRSHAPRE